MKKNIGIIFDSTCGRTKKQVEEDGNLFIPLIIYIDEKSYKSGIDIDNEKLFQIMKENKNVTIRTSTPLNSDFIDTFDKAIEKFDEVIYIGLSNKFSSTIDMAKKIIEENKKYKNKIFVYNSWLSSPWTPYLYQDINDKVKKDNLSKDQIFNLLDSIKEKMIGYLSPGNIFWFFKGGRITRNQYLISNLLKIFPILIVERGRINPKKVIKVRTIKNVPNKMISLLKEEIKNIDNYKIGVLKSDNKDLIELTVDSLKKELKISDDMIVIMELSVEQSAHMGPESIGIALLPNIK